MTEDEANGYVARYRNIWRGGPSTDELREQLRSMDAGTFGTALVRLARSVEDPPSIARLWRAYRDLDTPANDPLPVTCDACSDGWTTVSYVVEGRTYRAAAPCLRCGLRRGTHRAWTSCLDVHDALLRALGKVAA